jgi:hypothetical protein
MKIKLVLVGVLLCLVTGCSFFNTAQDRGASAADAELEAAVYALCTVPTQGAVKRRWPTEGQRELYDKFCEGEGQ